MRGDFAAGIFDIHFGPILLIVQHDRGFDHVEGRGVSSGFGPPDFPEDVMNFRKGFDDLVGLLENLARFGGRNAGESCRHVEQVAFIERWHEFGAKILIGEKLADFLGDDFEWGGLSDLDALFPLTPGPSPLGRGESSLASLVCRRLVGCGRTTIYSWNSRAALPLPWGEGRGEGNRTRISPKHKGIRLHDSIRQPVGDQPIPRQEYPYN